MIKEKLYEREQSGNPIKVAVVGAGRFGTSVVAQVSRMKGMRVAAIADLAPEKAVAAWEAYGAAREDIVFADDAHEADAALARSKPVVAEDSDVLCACNVDVVVEATGLPEVGARVGYQAIQHGKHVVMVNVEADVTVGRALKKLADSAGVVYSIADGDQPGVINGMCDWAEALGFEVVAAGRGTLRYPFDRTGTPGEAFQRLGFTDDLVRRRQLNPQMYNSFRDGTKAQIEMCSVANMTGLVPDVRGMHEPSAGIADLPGLFRPRGDGGILSRKGCVELANAVAEDGESLTADHIAIGVFVVVTSEHPLVRDDIAFYGLCMSPDGRYGVLTRDYHLCGVETPMTIAQAALFHHATGAPLPAPVAEVLSVAKCDLKAGTTLDGSGGYTVYGLIERADIARQENALPLGLTYGARLRREVPHGAVIKRDMVALEEESFVARLRRLLETDDTQ